MPDRGICAHRGASDTHPENTLAAFREAIMLGAQMIEFDVALTKDNHAILMHDATVDRTTNGKGRVADLTFAEIRKLDAGKWKNSKYSGERVPTLREALDMMPENIWLNVHLKGDAQLAKTSAAKTTEECKKCAISMIKPMKTTLHPSILARSSSCAAANGMISLIPRGT